MLTRKHFLLGLAAAGALAMDLRHAARAQGGSPFPLQLDARVPFEPRPFAGLGGTYIAYELYLTNASAEPMTLRRMEILDGSRAVAAFEALALEAILQPVGGSPARDAGPNQISAGATFAVFLWLQIETGAAVPRQLRHRVVTAAGMIEGTTIAVRDEALPVLAPPVRGEGWMVSNGPGNARGNHHRRGIIVVDGNLSLSRRFAIDWFLRKGGVSVSGPANETGSYFTYGQPVYAVADAGVHSLRDGQPDNIPGPVESFRPAIPVTMDTVAGNHIVLDLGGGRYAWYCHLQPGSIPVTPGNRVRRGQLLGRIGCSGDANLPHLHFEVTTSPKLLAGEGLPYLIDEYRLWTDGGTWQARRRELPLDRMLLDLG